MIACPCTGPNGDLDVLSRPEHRPSGYGPIRWIFNRLPGRAPARFVLALVLALALAMTMTMTMAVSAPALAAAAPVRIGVLGDSLSAGYQLPPGQGLIPQLEAALRQDGYAVSLINGAVSGDTSAGGRARLDWFLGDKPDLVVVELGANDMLRGIDPATTRANLDAILAQLHGKGVAVVLAGMKAQPNLGRDYAQAFDAIYPDLAQRHGVRLYPFILDKVALDPALTLPDRLHPNDQGVAVMVRGLKPVVEQALKALKPTP